VFITFGFDDDNVDDDAFDFLSCVSCKNTMLSDNLRSKHSSHMVSGLSNAMSLSFDDKGFMFIKNDSKSFFALLNVSLFETAFDVVLGFDANNDVE
jgi:hypothetical protein